MDPTKELPLRPDLRNTDVETWVLNRNKQDRNLKPLKCRYKVDEMQIHEDYVFSMDREGKKTVKKRFKQNDTENSNNRTRNR